MTVNKRQIQLKKLRILREKAKTLSPVWVVNTNPLVEEKLVKTLLSSPRSKVLCVGCHGESSYDPSPAFIASKVRSKNVSIVDVQDMAGKLLLNKLLASGQRHLSQSSSLPVHLKDRILLLSQTVQHPSGIGQGGLMSYRKTMSWELPKSKRGIRLIPAVAWNTGIKENSLDLVLDRGTWPFILNQGLSNGKNFLSDSIKHYLNILRPGGKVVFMLPELQVEEHHEPTLRKNLKELLDQKQVHVKEIPLENLRDPYPSHKLTYAGYKYKTALVVTKLREKMI